MSQLQEGGDRFIARESRYATVEQVCLTVVDVSLHFKLCLATGHFVVQTDHKSLMFLDRTKGENGSLAKWPLALQPLDLDVQHQAGAAKTMQMVSQGKKMHWRMTTNLFPMRMGEV